VGRLGFFFYFGLFKSLFEKWTRWKVFSKSGPFQLRQSIWCDLWRSCTNLTGATRGADVWMVADVAPCGLGWLSHATIDDATGRRAILWCVSTSRAICYGATQSCQSDWRDKFVFKTHTGFFFGFSLSFSLSHARTGDRRRLHRCRRPSSIASGPRTPVLNLSQGNGSLLTEYIFNLISFIDVRNF
jgi:hypothetical protein